MEKKTFTNIVNSKIVEQAYEEAISPVAKQVGGLAEDTAKAFRLFAAPLQLLAVGQDRLELWLEQVRSSVPEDLHQDARPEIAGPAIMNLRFMEGDNDLHKLYLNLLSAAIDRERSHSAHPGFIKAIEHMAPRDAQLLQILFDTAPFRWVLYQPNTQPRPLAYMLNFKVIELQDWDEEEIQAGLEVLSGVSLIGYEEMDIRESTEKRDYYQSITCWVTQHGENFIEVCMPNGYPEKTA